MFNKLTYKQLFLGVVLASLIFFALAWNLSISPTLHLRSQVAQLEEQINGSAKAIQELASLRTEKESLESLLGTDNMSATMVQLQLLNAIDSLSTSIDVDVKEILPIHESAQSDYRIYTHIIKLQGGFADLLTLNSELEKKFKHARISAVHYDKETNLRTGKQTLYATLYVQNVWKI